MPQKSSALLARFMAKLYVVRHARAAAPDDLRLPGPDSDLRPEGWQEARSLAARLRANRPATVYASDARRAEQTGTVIAEECGIPLRVVPALREVDFGAWGGRTFTEIVADDPSAAAYFADPTSATPPGGETTAAVATRVLEVLQALAHRDENGIVVVGHTGSLRLALAQALGMPLAAYWRLRLDYAGLTVLTWTDGGSVVETLNDTAHLEDDRPSSASLDARSMSTSCPW